MLWKFRDRLRISATHGLDGRPWPCTAEIRSLSLNFLVAALLPALAGAEGFFSPRREMRSINTDQCEVVVQRNGQVAVKSVAGTPLLDGVYPAVRFADSELWAPLPTSPNFAQRMPVSDALGEGQGLVFARGRVEWYVASYPAKPFLTFRVVYVNTGKEPVQVAALAPLATGGRSPGGWRTGGDAAAAVIVDNGRLFTAFDDFPQVHTGGGAAGQWNLSAYDPRSSRSLVAGFLTVQRAYGEVVLDRTPEAEADLFDVFRGACLYDPPVTVAPGARLESEVFYVALAEASPLEGLGRYARAVAVWNGVPRARPFVPHGWDSWSTSYHHDIDEAHMLAELDALDAKLAPWGWKYFAIDAGWERERGDWWPDPRKFPNGLKPLADEIHRRGMKAGLWIDPFTVDIDSDTAKAHPEWLLEPTGKGRLIMGSDLRVLDVTRPEVCAHVRDTAHRIAHEWGFDAIMEADFTYHVLLVKGFAEAGLTHVEILQRGLRALRDGIGDDRFLMAVTPQMLSGVIADGVRVGRDCAPVWKAASRSQSWGAVDALTNAIRRFYVAPSLFLPDADVVFFDDPATRARWRVEDQPALTWDQSLAWLTGVALTGGPIKVGEPFSRLGDRAVAALRMTTPSVPRPAVPLDLYQDAPPRIWHLELDTPTGLWQLLALFNWDPENPAVIAAPLDALGFYGDAWATVYDVWNGAYGGTAQGTLPVEIKPGGVRLLGFRRHTGRPMLIASTRHIAMGALDHTRETWDPAARTLHGEFDPSPPGPYTLRILVPDGYTPAAALSTAGPAQLTPEGRTATLHFTAPPGGPCAWSVRFD